MNSCIHSGSNDYTSGNTVWYNYTTASAGTISGTSNTNATTESICPKGWNLPSKKQIDTIGGASPGSTTYVDSFSPVLGGYYFYGTLNYESTYGYWWGSTAYNGARRYSLGYNGSSLYTDYNNRYDGLYIRCVSEEKDVSDLTYMQDMTPSIATNTAEGTTASLTDRRDGKVYTVAKINGNMWMTQNLRLGYNSSNPDTYTLDLTEQDSNITFTQAEASAGKRTLQLYDLVSRGTNTSGSNQCYGTYDSSTGTGTGAGYTNSCIHSGTISNIDANTVWYNYALASAETVIGDNNSNTATQSICPKGWLLPSTAQINTLSGGDEGSATYVPNFYPILGGGYYNATPYNIDRGIWWSSEAYDGLTRNLLTYDGSSLITSFGSLRRNGLYIRCVSSS